MADNPTGRERTLALQKRSFEWSCAILRAYPKKKYLDEPSRIIWRELLKSAASATFNLEEADGASSPADFVAKMRIALREAKEAHAAIRMIMSCELTGHEAVMPHQDEARQLASIFNAIVKNARANMKRR